MATERDKTIGKNVQRYRGDKSQQWLADEMRELGYRWSQATVWAVEKGTRALQLSEATDLAPILGLNDAAELAVTEEDAKLFKKAAEVARRRRRLREAMEQYLDDRAELEDLFTGKQLDWSKVGVDSWAAAWAMNIRDDDIIEFLGKIRDDRGSSD